MQHNNVTEVLTKLLVDFGKQKEAHAVSKNTYGAYAPHWQSYINQLDEDMVQSFEDVTPATVKKYLRSLVKTPAAYNQARAAIFRLLRDSIALGADIPRFEAFGEAVKGIKVKSSSRLFMDDEQMDTVYSNLMYRGGYNPTSIVFRDLLIFRIIRETLLRAEEIRNINVSDIDVHGRSISVRGKGAMIDEDGNKVVSRLVYCSQSLIDNIDEYMSKHRKKSKSETQKPLLGMAGSNDGVIPLFTSTLGLRLSDKSIKGAMSNAIKRSLPSCELKSSSGAHSIRRSSATIIYSKTHDVVLVQNMLGHADPKTTMAYIGLGDADLRTGFDILNGEKEEG